MTNNSRKTTGEVVFAILWWDCAAELLLALGGFLCWKVMVSGREWRDCPTLPNLTVILSIVGDRTCAGAELTDNLAHGYVYLFRHGTRREFKIGKTRNLLRREGQVDVELPLEIEPIHKIKTDDPSGVESYRHRRFESKRLKGVWFELSRADVRAFQRWKKIILTGESISPRTQRPCPGCSVNVRG